ncbi:fluoride efflux transporter CrcB [Halobacillus andaensis]|uniref:fluoride efflux transporter CrcB n=1 Tax=Halobacillus andaensis TaxID=1176239 RepID=UPI003D72A706
MIYLWVGVAGFIGAAMRYGVGAAFYNADAFFPFSTLSANLIGSFLLAWFTIGLVQHRQLPESLKTAIGTGLIGSFTTFSTLSVETVMLFERGSTAAGVLYVLLSISGGLFTANLGYALGGRKKTE